jgi:hypothetical protein
MTPGEQERGLKDAIPQGSGIAGLHPQPNGGAVLCPSLVWRRFLPPGGLNTQGR